MTRARQPKGVPGGGRFVAKGNPESDVGLVGDPGLTEELLANLPPATAEAWKKLAPLLPSSAYLAGGTALAVHFLHRLSRDLDIFLEQPEDLAALWSNMNEVGKAFATWRDGQTINCTFDGTKVQVLEASTQTMLRPTTVVGGIRVASVEDILAMKLATIVDRGMLRDYFDLMVIEQQTSLRVEAGIPLSVRRYAVEFPDSYAESVVRSLGYFGDVVDDGELPSTRSEIERYWTSRLPGILKHLEMFGGS